MGPGRNSSGFFITSRNTPFKPKYDDNAKVPWTSCRNRKIKGLPAEIRSRLALTNVRPRTKFVYFRLHPRLYRKDFLMLRSLRAGAILIALLTSSVNTPFARAQTANQAHPFFLTMGAGKKSVVGYTPAQIRHGYGFDQIAGQGEGQTIAIVDAFDHPNIEQDLAIFNSTFSLPSCTTANGCFRKVYASGSKPETNSIWAFEISLDVEWAHAIAPQAKILLVEAPSDQLSDLLAAVDVATASNPKPTAVSMSWGLNELASEISDDSHFVGKNVTFFAASGDLGHGVIYPAASPFVMGVGGTTLALDKDGNVKSEKAWSGSGGGLSSLEPEPVYQRAFPIPNNPLHMRGTPDVAYDGDPNTGVATYDSVSYLNSTGWFQVGGTSVGPPQWAALFAIANSMRGVPLTGSTGLLYDIAKQEVSDFRDVKQGRNGPCQDVCTAEPGYDYVTGLGSPQADALIPDLMTLR
jgi:subtilase family serine protease